MKYIEQNSLSECGLCCLAMICSDFKINVSITSLREKFSIGRNGLSFMDMKKIFHQIGLEAKGYKIKKLSDIPTPYILFINNNHYVCVKKITKHNKAIIYDPAHGIYKKEISQMTSPFIILKIISKSIVKNVDYTTNNRIISVLKEYFSVIRNKVSLICKILFLAIIVQLLSVAIPILFKFVINDFINSNLNLAKVIYLAVFLILTYGISFYLKGKLTVKLQTNFNNSLSEQFVKKLFSLPYNFFSLTDSADLVHRYNGSVVVRNLLSQKLINIWLSIGTIMLALIYVFTQSRFIGFFLLFMGTIQIIVSLIGVHQKQYLLGKEILEQSNSLSKFMDMINLMPYIKFSNLERVAFNKWSMSQQTYSKSMIKAGNFSNYFSSINATINYLTPIIATIFATFITLHHQLTIGSIFAIFMLSSSVISPLSQLIDSIDDILYSNKYFERMNEIQKNKSEMLDMGIKVSENSHLNIEIKNVSFKYDFNTKNDVLNDINLNINDGEFIGITGKTGSGKSTLGLVVLGQLPTNQGKILINGKDLKKINKSSFRKKCSIVTQKSTFCTDSILNNITMWQKVDDKQLEKVCKIACIWDDIQKLPMKFETVISKDDNVLSGGQLQRISIARALYSNPKIILLDEATSALDAKTENQIMINISKLNCTRIFITHRLNTIKDANKIIFMDKGHIVARGPHDDLLKISPKYRSLYQKFSNK
ncbi:peptidase domain-containing ABC transporter [Ligilactobacillus sp. LYQ135]